MNVAAAVFFFSLWLETVLLLLLTLEKKSSLGHIAVQRTQKKEVELLLWCSWRLSSHLARHAQH